MSERDESLRRGRGPASLSLNDVRLAYGSVVALDGVSLQVEAGECMALVGPSGCGKSSLIAAIAGLVTPDGGSITLGGRDLAGLEPGDRNLSVVFQSFALFPTMSARQNIMFGMRMRRVPRPIAEERLAQVARFLKIENLLDRRPHELSGGQRQRVAIARALVREPDLFLLDEPLSNLDAALRAELRQEIRHIHERLGTTMLFVTHDQAEAMSLADRLAVMRDGRVLQAGTPWDVYDRPQTLFVAGFIGQPRINLLPARLHAPRGEIGARLEDGTCLSLADYAWREPPQAGREVIVGVRPDDITLSGEGSAALGKRRVVTVEPSGGDVVVGFEMGSGTLLSRLPRDAKVHAGQDVEIAMNPRRVSVFCPRTEARL